MKLDQADQYLHRLFDDLGGSINVRFITADGECTSHFAASAEAALKLIEDFGDGTNVYVGIATRRDDKSGAKGNLSEARALWVDADFKHDEDKDALKEKLKGFPMKPSMLAWSGGGVHAYWHLAEPFGLDGPEAVASFEATLRGLANYFDTDRAVTDASRILRVPGTVNHPDLKKRAAGRVEAECKLLAEWDHWEERSYSFGDFGDMELRGRALMGPDSSTNAVSFRLDAELSEKTHALIKSTPRIAERFARGAEGLDKDTSESAVDMSLATMLHNAGVTPEQITAALYESRKRAGLDLKRPDYYARTVSKAVASNAAGRNEKIPEAGLNYRVMNNTLIHRKNTRDGLVNHPLCNFNASIVREEVRDDGVEQQVNFIVTGILANGSPLPETIIPADRFASLSWIPGAWGTRAIVNAGSATKDHLRCAIQLLSKDVSRSVVFTHSGWREIDGQQTYLHGGGGINCSGHVEGMSVSLPGSLDRFELPPPPEGEAERVAVRASLRLLDVAPDRITAPLLSMIFRSVLEPADFGGHLSGLTGVFKTELAALAQSHFGRFDSRHLPASWSSTGNALEGLAFVAKDALLVIDDFAPHGTASDVARQNRDADRVFRAQGNRSGRARMWADGTLRQVRPPRGMILSTGEDVPTGQSLRARILVLEVGPKDVDLVCLTRSQKDAAEGLLAGALSAFIRWLASRLDDAQQQLRDSVVAWRGRSLAHRRAPDMLGQLSGAWDLFLDYATEADAISREEREVLRPRVDQALLEVGLAQAEHQKAADPIDYFLRLLTGAFVSGEAHLADADTLLEPEQPGLWGWRARRDQKDQSEEETWDPLGRRIGWLRGGDVYLEGESSFGIAQRLASQQGISLGLGQRTLWKRMDERGLLVTKEIGRFTIRPRIGGVQQRAIHISAEVLGSTSGLSGLSGLDATETAGETIRTESEPASEPTPSTDRAQEWAQTQVEASEMGVSAPESPVSPLSPLVGGDTQLEPEGHL